MSGDTGAPPHLLSAAAAWERILGELHPDRAWIVGVRGHGWQAGIADAEPAVEPLPVKPPARGPHREAEPGGRAHSEGEKEGPAPGSSAKATYADGCWAARTLEARYQK